MEKFDSIQLYFKEIKNLPQFTKEDAAVLWAKAYKGNKRAQKKLVEANLRLVIPIAKRFFRGGMDFLDLIEEGNMGLMRAVEKFDPGRNVSFSTYATYWVEQSVRRAIEEQGKTIRIPPHVWDGLGRLSKNAAHFQATLGRNPTMKEVGKKLKLSAHQVKNLFAASKVSQGASSIETPIDPEGNIFMKDVISDKKSSSPESITELLRHHADINYAINILPPREKTIILLRFGLGGNKPESLELIGKKMRLSRERVRQLEERSIRRLKSIALRTKLIDLKDSKQVLADDRVEKRERRKIQLERRLGKADKRKVKVERRRSVVDRRNKNFDRRK